MDGAREATDSARVAETGCGESGRSRSRHGVHVSVLNRWRVGAAESCRGRQESGPHACGCCRCRFVNHSHREWRVGRLRPRSAAPTVGAMEVVFPAGQRLAVRGVVDRCGTAHGASGAVAVLMGLPSGSRIWLAAGFTDLRKGMDGLSALVQTALHGSPYSGHIFVFRGRRGDKIKVLWHSGDGVCLFLQTLERGQVRVASGAERRGVDECGTAIDVAGGDRLAATEEKCTGTAGSGSCPSDASGVRAQ